MPPSFDELFRELRGRVLAVCFQMTGDIAEAEDATQETFIIVHRALPGFRGEAAPATWVTRIALRVAARSRKRRRRRGGVSLAREHAEDLAASPDPDALEQRDEVARVRAALAALSPDHRAVISLFAIDGLSHAEIADVLGIPEGTVWSRLHLARKKLRARLEATEANCRTDASVR
jgi:RNA polymerase sigma-70 factor (ECF subfamily)